MLMLKEFREASGLKISQVAERVGVPYETYRKWEKGDSNPNWEQLCRAADVLHCSLDDLTGRRETGHRISASYVPKIWRSLFIDGAPLDGLPFVTLGRMRATYSTMMQAAGVSESVINAMQGRSENSAVLYSNYLNPLSETFLSASRAMQDGFGA